jgi:putative transposase
MMSAQADAACGAYYGQHSAERINRRNGYRSREWDTRVGTVELAVPKLREGSFFPGLVLTHRRRAEPAWLRWWPPSTCLGVSTRRVERLAEQLAFPKDREGGTVLASRWVERVTGIEPA